ncbi:ADP-ribosylglycohydrolase family protein [Blastococcus sp. SYSU D00813]
MPLNTADAVTNPYRERPDADERELSAIRLVQALLAAPDLLPVHRQEMLRLALYKYSEARTGKHGLRFRTAAVMRSGAPARVEHEHVRSRLAVVTDLRLGGPTLAPLVLTTSAACLVTSEEHVRLRAVPPEVDGWARYAEAGLEVVDHLTGQSLDPRDLAVDEPTVELTPELASQLPGGSERICLLMACRLVSPGTSLSWAVTAAARDSDSIEGRWIENRLKGLAVAGDDAPVEELGRVLDLAGRIFESATLRGAADGLRDGPREIHASTSRRASLAADLARLADRGWGTAASEQAAPLALGAIAAARRGTPPLWDDWLRDHGQHIPPGLLRSEDTESAARALVEHFSDPVLAVALTIYVKRLRDALVAPPPDAVVHWVESRCAASTRAASMPRIEAVRGEDDLPPASGQDTLTDDLRTAARNRAARGLLLGLVLGDAVDACGGAVPPGAEALRGTVAGQLALVTTEGLVRASVRHAHKGICHPPSVVWHALVRWAHGQGIEAPAVYERWRAGAGTRWPDGWLADVPVLRQRRGSAPATVSALVGGKQGSRQEPTTSSKGAHGLVRTLPTALLEFETGEAFNFASDIAALTHGSPRGYEAAGSGAVIVSALISTGGPPSGLEQALGALSDTAATEHSLDLLHRALEDGRSRPHDVSVLRGYAVDKSAPATLSAAVYVLSSFMGSDDVAGALHFAGRAGGSGVAAVSGAMLGALHGVDALPVDLLSRAELSWVADTLARDLVYELTESPSGQPTATLTAPGHYTMGWEDGLEPNWWARYPGW